MSIILLNLLPFLNKFRITVSAAGTPTAETTTQSLMVVAFRTDEAAAMNGKLIFRPTLATLFVVPISPTCHNAPLLRVEGDRCKAYPYCRPDGNHFDIVGVTRHQGRPTHWLSVAAPEPSISIP